MKKENVIKSCYSILDRVTPLDFDCGRLCDGKCCKGDAHTGMLLFPGEEKLIDSDICINTNQDGVCVAVCDGSCNRHRRPLSCRIYPLFPVIENNGDTEYIDVQFDPRASCPLCEGEIKLNRRFVKAVKRVGKYLLLNKETQKEYREICEEIKDINKFRELLK
ncbi:MAG: hypothetical protein IIX14_07760 [Clostridia bacterium]|nr:hypothetical protein [Clostridia bacterium]